MQTALIAQTVGSTTKPTCVMRDQFPVFGTIKTQAVVIRRR